MNKKQIIVKLKKQFPGLHNIHDGKEWGGEQYKDSIHLGNVAEGGIIDGDRGADYNSWDIDPDEKIYILGVHKKLIDVLDIMGYFPEWYDAGTLLAWPK